MYYTSRIKLPVWGDFFCTKPTFYGVPKGATIETWTLRTTAAEYASEQRLLDPTFVSKKRLLVYCTSCTGAVAVVVVVTAGASGAAGAPSWSIWTSRWPIRGISNLEKGQMDPCPGMNE